MRGIVILECVHLLAHDVRLAAHCSRKQFRRLENGLTNLAEPERPKHFARGLIDAVPQLRLWRQQVARSFCRLEFCFCGHWLILERVLFFAGRKWRVTSG